MRNKWINECESTVDIIKLSTNARCCIYYKSWPCACSLQGLTASTEIKWTLVFACLCWEKVGQLCTVSYYFRQKVLKCALREGGGSNWVFGESRGGLGWEGSGKTLWNRCIWIGLDWEHLDLRRSGNRISKSTEVGEQGATKKHYVVHFG